MLPTDEKYGGWAASGEIDIMELVGHEPSTYHGTLHFGGRWPRNKHGREKYRLKAGTFAEDFHVFSLDWKKGKSRGRSAARSGKLRKMVFRKARIPSRLTGISFID